jgi:hypothetical protein
MFGGALGILHVECDRFHLDKFEKKKENVLALLADSNTEFKTSKWLCGITGDILHGPQEWRFLFAFDVILDVEKIEKSLSILYRNKEKLSFIVNNKILQILGAVRYLLQKIVFYLLLGRRVGDA